jgi:glycosyl transferase family 25
MKTFVISLANNKKRREYIAKHVRDRGLDFEIIDAVDGSKLSEHDIDRLCVREEIDKNPSWLNRGAIGCALSHQIAYKEIEERNLKFACIIEDDIILPSNFDKILKNIHLIMEEDEVIQLYMAPTQITELSSINHKMSANERILYPMNVDSIVMTAAYVIGRKAAINMRKINLPVQVGADTWRHFYRNKAFKSIRIMHPSPIKPKPFKNTIGYGDPNSLKEKISELAETKLMFILRAFIRFKRILNFKRRDSFFVLVGNKSPLDIY